MELKDAQARIGSLRTIRQSWFLHWRELANFMLPRRYTWLITPNEFNRGVPINQNIIDSTAMLAARTCASGMMAGITSPARPWFKLRIGGQDPASIGSEASKWLETVEKRMLRVMAESNFYNSMAVVFQDLSVFGTAAQLIYEDYEDVIRCYNPALGEFFVANDERFMGNTFARELTMTAEQIAGEFGEENCPEAVTQVLKTSPFQQFKVFHYIYPDKKRGRAFRELYWVDSRFDQPLRDRRYYEQFAFVPRWEVLGNDPYGRGPGMDALGDTKQLQVEQRRKAQAIDKMVNPPMLADIQLKNQPASILPGGVTYVAGMNNVGMKPVYQVNPPVQELMLDIKEIQQRVREVFYNDLFMMISQLDTVRSATEIDARREEKLVMLGPVLDRMQNEHLTPAITRIFNVMLRARLLPPPPEEIAGMAIEVQYVSMLAEAQRVAKSAGMERLAAQLGNLAAVYPDVLDVLDETEFAIEYADIMSVSPKVIRSREEIQQIRQQKAEQAQAQQMAAGAPDMAKAAELMSKTDVGGGINALQAMLQ